MMKNLTHYSQDDVRTLLTMNDCIEAVAHAMRDVSSGLLDQPPRSFERMGDLVLATMIGRSDGLSVYGIKVITLDQRNAGTAVPVIQGVITLFDAANSSPVATVDAQIVTAMRTAAASANASRVLSRDDAKSHGIVGTGVQAESHAIAMEAGLPRLESTKIWGRNTSSAATFVERMGPGLRTSITSASLDEVCSCDVVSVVTNAHEAIVFGDMFPDGVHINLVGTHDTNHREADTECIRRSRVYVDSLNSAYAEAGDLMIPVQEGAIDRSHILGEIGQVDLGDLAGRISSTDITLYKSVGIFAQDLYTAAHIVDSDPSSLV